MADKLIYKTSPTKIQIMYFILMKSVDTQLNEPANQNSIKVPKVVQRTNKKGYYKTFRTSVINSPMSPPSLKIIIKKYTL